jgi:hypothetical protein
MMRDILLCEVYRDVFHVVDCANGYNLLHTKTRCCRHKIRYEGTIERS